MRFGDRFEASAELDLTPAGLIGIGSLVGLVLLGTAAVVRAVRRVSG